MTPKINKIRLLINKIFIIYVIFMAYSHAEQNNKENETLYQIKMILVSHNASNYTEKNDMQMKSKYLEKKHVNLSNNNCLVDNDNTCIKYDNEYKLETFNSYIEILSKEKDISIISHLEWVQKITGENNIKIKGGYDYSNEVFENNLQINDIDILSSGKITKYEGFINITKNKFYTLNLKLFERVKVKSERLFSDDQLILKEYNISQKIKINKMTYIDRDNFGLIVKAIKISSN
tara:strand:+ start:1119 stop:1820 length:702 start_codon:yes stop_codon:yes gene_type:complete